ncbi:hypothetical protein M0Q28_06975 [Patescibacteria group bacterium]|jgi:hypothetical protein|nr:hypothetical protein [Patescibacteria group bacterium]
MANGDGKVNWGMIRDVAQYLIYPILMALVYLMMQNQALDRRLSTIEIVTSRPVVDIESVRKIAVIEDRQNRNIQAVLEIKGELDKHRELSEVTGYRKR